MPGSRLCIRGTTSCQCASNTWLPTPFPLHGPGQLAPATPIDQLLASGGSADTAVARSNASRAPNASASGLHGDAAAPCSATTTPLAATTAGPWARSCFLFHEQGLKPYRHRARGCCCYCHAALKVGRQLGPHVRVTAGASLQTGGDRKVWRTVHSLDTACVQNTLYSCKRCSVPLELGMGPSSMAVRSMPCRRGNT